MKLLNATRWVAVPFSSMAACAGTLTATDLVGRALATTSPPSIESMLPLDVRIGMAYAVAAALFVVVGAIMAPGHRIIVAGILYLLGATVAWYGLKDWYFPEHHSQAYQPSLVPMWLTLSGGMVGIIVVSARSHSHKRTQLLDSAEPAT